MMRSRTENLVLELSPLQYSQWDSFVEQSPQGAVFCYSWWLEAITNGNFKILAVFRDHEIVAGIPLAYYLEKINEPPLTRTLGPLFKELAHLSEHDRITLHRSWLNLLLDQLPFNELEQFCTSPAFTDWLPFRWRGIKQDTRYTYIIRYKDKTTDDLRGLLNQNKKRDLAKAQKNNLRVEVSDDFDLLYELAELTYQRQKLTFNFARDDFRRLDDALRKRDQRRIFAVFTQEDQAVAAVYIAWNGKAANYLIGGTHPGFYDLGGSTLALWEAIQYFNQKADCFNFCGSNIQSIEHYFRGFGGELTPYFHLFAEKRVEINQDLPLVSVVTACYNHGKFIPEMLDSVLNQTYRNFEVIIVDDGSTDNTAEMLKGISLNQVKVIHTENRGPAHARNLAVQHARGDLIFNLDADNKIAPSLIEKCVALFQSRPNAGIVYSDLVYIGHRSGPFHLPDFSLEEMLKANCIDASACFRKADWATTGGYSPAFKNAYEDFDFWLSILELGREVHKIKEPLTFYRTYENCDDCRSERTKKNPGQVEEVILLAFQRHRELYKKVPEIYHDFSEKERQYYERKKPTLNDATSPVFSIVTPTNNRPQLLRRAIASVLSQSFSDFEQIIIDDANSRETEELIRSYGDQRLKYIAHPKPSGAGAAYNTGMRQARGKFINFLDDDDEYLPGILQKIHDAFLTSSGNPGYIWTGITRVMDTENGEEHLTTQVWPEVFPTREDGLTIATAIGNGYGFSIRRECVEAIGEYDTTLTTGQDTDFLIRLAKRFEFRTIPEVLVKIHHHPHARLSDLGLTTLRWRCYRDIMERHFDFLSGHFKVIHIHSLAYLNLCYQLKKKNAGRKFLFRILKRYPFKKILYQDLWSYERYGKDYFSFKSEPAPVKSARGARAPEEVRKMEPAIPAKKDGAIKVLSIGSNSSFYLAGLYGRISHRTGKKILFTIAGEKQFAEGVDGPFMELISYRNIFEKSGNFHFSLVNLLLKYVTGRKKFGSFIRLRSELWIVAFETNFNLRHFLKEMHTVLKYRYFGNIILRPLFQEYDVVQIQFLSQEYLSFVWYVPHNVRVIGTFWGSDLMRKSGMMNYFYLKNFLDRSTLYTAPSLELREIILSKFGRDYYPKFREIRFPMLDSLFDTIDRAEDVVSVRRRFISGLGMDPDKKNLVVGHNGSRFNNHLYILKALKKSALIDLKEYNVFIPVAYFPDGPEYKREILAAIDGIPNVCLIEKLLFGDEFAALRLSTDFFLHLPQSDAMSATLIESIYAGAVPIVGSWLPYGNFDRFGLPLVRVDDFSEIPEKILDHQYKYSRQIRDNINRFLRSENVLDQWIEIYNSRVDEGR